MGGIKHSNTKCITEDTVLAIDTVEANRILVTLDALATENSIYIFILRSQFSFS